MVLRYLGVRQELAAVSEKWEPWALCEGASGTACFLSRMIEVAKPENGRYMGVAEMTGEDQKWCID